MSIEKKIFDQKIYNADNDLKKRWFIRVKVPHFEKGCFVWKKCYGDINKFQTVPERTAELLRLYNEIKETGTYTAFQGSRKPGAVNENYYTDLVYQFNQQLSIRGHRIRLSTRRKYAGIVKNMAEWLQVQKTPNLPVGAFTANHAKIFLEWIISDKKMSPASYNDHLRLFKSFFSELVIQTVVKKNPFDSIRGMKKNSTPALYFQREQLATLKGALIDRDPELWIFVQFIYYTFLRPGEIRQLKIADIIFEERKIRVPGNISKNGKMQYVTIPEVFFQKIKFMAALDRNCFLFGDTGYGSKKPLAVNAMKNRHRAILKSLNFSSAHKLYSWKHTGAIACAKSGMSLKDLQMQLRHHSLDQVDQYLRDMLVFESDFIKNNFPEI